MREEIRGSDWSENSADYHAYSYFSISKSPYLRNTYIFESCVTVDLLHRVPIGARYGVSLESSFLYSFIAYSLFCMQPVLDIILSGNNARNNIQIFMHNKNQGSH